MATPATDATDATDAIDAPEIGAATALELDLPERDVLVEEIGAFAATLSEPDSRARYAALAEVVQQGAVPPELLGFLDTMLELVLQTQRVRRQHGPEAEQALLRLWQRGPRGAALKEAAQDVNEALSALRGQALESVTFSPSPRGHKLVVATERCYLTLAIDRAGVRVEAMEVGG